MILRVIDCAKKKKEIYNYHQYFDDLLYILTIVVHNMQKGIYDTHFHGKPLKIEYIGKNKIKVMSLEKIIQNEEFKEFAKYNPTIDDFWQVLIDVIDKLNEIGYLR